jgi:hypothetical protein
LSAEVSAGRIFDYIRIYINHSLLCLRLFLTRLASHTSCMAGHLSLVEEDEDLFEFLSLFD